MRRNKIKQKYLKLIKPTSKNNTNISNVIDNTEKKIIKSLISFTLIILMLFWGIIPSIILHSLNINPDNLSNFTKYTITFINDFIFLSLLILIYFKDLKNNFKNYFNKDFLSNLKLSLKYWGIGLIIMVFSNYIISIITGGQLAQNEETVREMIEAIPFYMTFQLMVYAPLSEELIFRRSLKDIFNNKWSYAIVSGVIFGGLHAISSITNLVSLLYLIPYCSLGIIFGLLYYKTNNIFSTIIVHSIHNTLALILYLTAL